MTRLRGWAPRGHKLLAKVPQGHWKTLTFLAALRCDRIDAPCVIDGPIDGESFLAYVEQVLVPTFRAGDIVIFDNLGSHKGKAVRRAIRAAGAKLFFCRTTALISTRSSRSSPNSRPCSEKPPGEHRSRLAPHRNVLRAFTPQECANYSETPDILQNKRIDSSV